MSCICGHPEKDHVLSGKCRVPDCPCERFQPGEMVRTCAVSVPGPAVSRGAIAPVGEARPPRRTSPLVVVRRRVRHLPALLAVLAVALSPGLVHAAGPAVILPSFAEVAATARAASVVIRAAGADAIAEDVVLSVPAGSEFDKEIQVAGGVRIR